MKVMAKNLCVLAAMIAVGTVSLQAQGNAGFDPIPTSKSIAKDLPGNPRQLNSLPMVMAVSPDGRYVATVNAGYGTAESLYDESISLLDTTTDSLRDFPEERTARGSGQTFFSGLAFSADGTHLYASLDSMTDPDGKKTGDTGNVVAVYAVKDGAIMPERTIAIPEIPAPMMATGAANSAEQKPMNPYPTAIAVTKTAAGAEALLVADNLSDDAVLVDAASGAVLHRFILSSHYNVVTEYPIAVAVTKDGDRAFVALWNASEIAELNLHSGKVTARLALMKPTLPVAAGSHPSALELGNDGKLYVVLTNRDRVAVVDVKAAGKPWLVGVMNAELPGEHFEGAQPVALALGNGKLYVADADANAVAVFSTGKIVTAGVEQNADGFIPTGWYPMSLAVTGGKLYIATGKSRGTGPNNFPQAPVAGSKARLAGDTYIGTLVHGSLAELKENEVAANLKPWSGEVVAANHTMDAAAHATATGGLGKIKHVIYIIKENRTYDQILGDLQQNGKPVGNGDASLTMYGAEITPNQHKLALEFGVFDNFYDSGEVSGVGHVWSTAAITSDYTEKTWQQSYRGPQRTYDYEGVVNTGYPLLEGIPDVNEPGTGYLWGNLARHGKSYIHFGEFVSTKFCSATGTQPKAIVNPQNGTPMETTSDCTRAAIRKGEEIPAVYGGGVSPYPWAIPMVAQNIPTKPELRGHFDPQYPDFNLSVPDQLRVSLFEGKLKQWVEERKAGKAGMPAFVMLRMGNDHTAGTSPGMPMPKASVADNDLAVGRAVEAVSHSPYWEDTAFFIVEDDAQNGADHVNAHRSTALVISKYAHHDAAAFVDSNYYTTVSMVRTMEVALGLPPMNFNDGYAPVMAPVFGGDGKHPAYDADYSNRDNGLIYTANAPRNPSAKQSGKMDFTHPDQADSYKLNVILWKDAMGAKPLPAELKHRSKEAKEKDDDDE